MPPFTPSPEHIEKLNKEWIEPWDEESKPSILTFGVYDTKVRGEGTQGSYWYKVPAGYQDVANSSRRYPVIFWLHGGMSRASQGAKAVERYTAAMDAGKMPPSIIVLPQGLPVGWYLNSIDYTFPIEDVIIKDFVPHIDATFRTNGQRGIEGFSMGGYGSAHLGFKYSDLFCGISVIAPAILPSLAQEPKVRIWDTFKGSQDYYDECHPATIAKRRKDMLRDSSILIRLLSGGDDQRLAEAIVNLSTLLNEAKINHYRKDVSGAGHDYDLILEGLGDDAYSFWRESFQ